MRIETTAQFTCPIERLFSWIEEPDKQKTWMKGLLANESTSPGPRGVGSTFRMKIKEGGKVAEYDGEVTVYDPPHRLEVIFWGGNFPAGCKVRVDYQLNQVGEQTHLAYRCAMEGKKFGLFWRMMMVLAQVFGKMQLRSFLRTLKQQVEAPARAA
jgi:uncharacterized protein YndB with AHSA1/START domain